MCDFEKKFRSCGKVTSLSLTVNAISAKNSACERLFRPSTLRAGAASCPEHSKGFCRLLPHTNSIQPNSTPPPLLDVFRIEKGNLFLEIKPGRNHHYSRLPISVFGITNSSSVRISAHSAPLRYLFPLFTGHGSQVAGHCSSHSLAKCLTNFPNGGHKASTFPKSSDVKSPPASIAVAPLRLICITPTTFPSHKIGALTIFWIDSPVVVAAFTPSNTVACRTAEKLLLISGRLSLAVRAASADVLDIGMNPTFFSACGTRKCRCLHRVDTPRIATSSGCTPRFFAIFSATAPSGISTGAPPSTSNASASRSNSVTSLVDISMIFSARLQGSRGALPNDSVYSSFMFIAFLAPCNHLSHSMCPGYTSFCSGHLQVATPQCNSPSFLTGKF